MTPIFEFSITPQGTEFRLAGPAGPVLVNDWALQAPTRALPGIDLLQRLIAAESAIAEGEVVIAEHRAIAELSVREAEMLGLPPVAQAFAEIRSSGVMTRSDFRATLQWKRPSGQPWVGARRCGAWLRIGEEWGRLPDVLFQVAEAVDAMAAVPGDDLAGRLAAIAALRDVLPAAQTEGSAEAPGLLGNIVIATADAFSLDLKGDGERARLVPILHRAGCGDAALLPADQQTAFGEDQFNRFAAARSVYAIGRGVFVVLAAPLRRALAEVRRVQSAPLATKRALLAAPRAFLREALGEDVDTTVLEEVFRETAAYSERVAGLGLWQPRVLPWIALETNDWFDGAQPGGSRSPRDSGLLVGDRRLVLDDEQLAKLRTEVEDAIARGLPFVRHGAEDGTVDVPATPETLRALESITAHRQRLDSNAAAKGPEGRTVPDVLLIRPNEETVDIEAAFTPRPAAPEGIPVAVRTALKPHQAEGLLWLQQAWTRGSPGTLLADDMGLGKTLQALGFLAWLREAIKASLVQRAPVLIVAPTGLLENWRAEHDRHLHAPGLGTCLAVYGRGLAALRNADADGRPALDLQALRNADWVMTTYETLRDYDRDFGRVRFAVLVFDEAQKIKTPGVRMTDAAKAMNAEFRLALTGTPVENRLAELWCIVDTVHPAYLDDLRTFSARYERDADPDQLRRMKRLLDSPVGGCPPLMLRRLKEDRLPELPSRQERLLETQMPEAQRAAYLGVVEEVRGGAQGGAVLAALQRLRAISLHPDPAGGGGDDAFVARSARLAAAIAALDQIHRLGESALVFLDDLDMQARLAGLLQRRYGLSAPPAIINGQVSGGARQARVDHFQQVADGFGVMLLSPRAGGVGLTLTRANHVIHLSRWWNPAVEDQCNGRALRIGQTRPVTTHIPVAVLSDGHRSFDQNLHALLERKRQLMRDALCPPAATDADYKELLRETVG